MFERFTDRARSVVVLAQEEARFLNHDYIGSEHVLLGLIGEGEGIAARALQSLGMTAEKVRDRVVEMVGRGEKSPTDHIPFTAEAKDALEMSLRESIRLGHNYIGTEHILLGLLAMPDSVACQALQSFGVDPGTARHKVGDLLGDAGEKVGRELPRQYQVPRHPGVGLSRREFEPDLISAVFVLVALAAIQIEDPTPEIARWGLGLLLGGVLVLAGGSIVGTGSASGRRARGAGRYLRLLGALTLAAAAAVFLLGALLG
jgi:hypothetical protein